MNDIMLEGGRCSVGKVELHWGIGSVEGEGGRSQDQWGWPPRAGEV